MPFTCSIRVAHRQGLVLARVDVLLAVYSSGGEVERHFRFDSGCDITTVSEDIAAVLELPAGGPTIQVGGVGGNTQGRMVDVRYRYPANEFTGVPGKEVDGKWVVVPQGGGIALLSFSEVHQHFTIGSDDSTMYFTEW
ncbi:MAG TPA: hypothetical protein VMZ71_11235 [Gemmataceae bacterium]|nr:hypothetical protein [Gemmataceae bacterium]